MSQRSDRRAGRSRGPKKLGERSTEQQQEAKKQQGNSAADEQAVAAHNNRASNGNKTSLTVDLQAACGDSTALLRLIIARYSNLKEGRWNKRGKSNVDIFWTGRQASNSNYSYTRLDPGRAITNHFPGIVDICSKAQSTSQLNMFQHLFGPEKFNFYPVSMTLPAQMDLFKTIHDPNVTYIVKPNIGSQGTDIHLASSLADIENILKANPDRKDQPLVERGVTVQRYIANPLLLKGIKFDFRIYVMVSSVAPLKIHIYREGLARFCTVKYQAPHQDNYADTYMHLTNYILQ
jgi:hypothetical protein